MEASLLKHFAACLLGLAALLGALAPAAAEKRVALVIGNARTAPTATVPSPEPCSIISARKARGSAT
jgi:hypothetical protein